MATETELVSYIIHEFQSQTAKYNDVNSIVSNIPAITSSVINKVNPYLLDKPMAEKHVKQALNVLINKYKKQTHFTVTDFFNNTTSKTLRANKSKAKELINRTFGDKIGVPLKSLYSAKEIELNCGYPLLSWSMDMFMKDRIDTTRQLGQYAHDYNLQNWFNDNLFCQYLMYTCSQIANKLQKAMSTICKHVLPPLKLNNVQFVISDDLNQYIKYIIAIHAFIESIVSKELNQIFPLHIDFLIIPNSIKNHIDNSFKLRHSLRMAGYEENSDYYVERVERDALPMQLKRIWLEKGHGDQYSHQRYVVIIDRRNGKQNDEIYLIIPKGKKHGTVFDEYYHINEALLCNTQTIYISDSVKAHSLGLSYHLFSKNNCKAYGYMLNNGSFKLELNDIPWLWPRYFSKTNGILQTLNTENINALNATKPLPNIQFQQFWAQSHDATNFVFPSNNITSNGKKNILSFQSKREIIKVFTARFNADIASKILTTLLNLLADDTYSDTKSIVDDLNCPPSKILNKLLPRINHLLPGNDLDKQESRCFITRQLRQLIVNNGRTFDIKQFKFDKSSYEKYCEPATALQHALQCEYADINNNNMQYNNDKCGDISLITTKAMELCNNYPIRSWLLDLYSMERAAKFDGNNASEYNLNHWIADNNYCKWIDKRFPKAMTLLKTSLDVIIKRIFPQLKLRYPTMYPLDDVLDDSAIYSLAFYVLVYRIKGKINDKTFECAPLQIDVILICSGKNSAPNVKRVNDDQFPIDNDEDETYSFGTDGSGSSGLIDAILRGLYMNKDYFECTQEKELIFNKLVDKLYKMWVNHGQTGQRRKKYIFVVDRQRNKWNDTIYFVIQPDCLPVEWYELQEICLTSCGKYLISTGQNTFGFSYHLLQSNNIKSYLYLNNGAKTFALQDINCIFPKFFKEIDGRQQRLSKDVQHKIEEYQKDKKLENRDFAEFARQCKHINDDREGLNEYKLNVIDENSNDDEELDEDLLRFVNKEKLLDAARKVLATNVCDMVADKIWRVLKREIIEQELDINDVKQEMQQLQHSKLLKTVRMSGPEYTDEIFIIFTIIFGDNTLLTQEIKENDHDTQCNVIIKIRKRAIEIKKHAKYKQMMAKHCELSSDEIFAVIYFSSYMNQGKYLNLTKINSVNWKYLFYYVRNAVSKLFKVFHHGNKQQMDCKTLYNGNAFNTLQQLSNREIPLIFNTRRQDAIKNGKKMMIVVKDSKIGLINGQLFGANIGWLTAQNDETFIILPHSYRNNNFCKIKRKLKMTHTLPTNINIFMSNKYKVIIHPQHEYEAKITTVAQGIDDIRGEIVRIFRIRYTEEFTRKLLSAFNYVIDEEEFDEIESMSDDLSDADSSAIFKSIWAEIGGLPGIQYSITEKGKILSTLQDILSGKARLFAIKDFRFTIKQKDVILATQLVKKECSVVYDECNNNSNSRANIAEDKSLCIAKAVDERNGYTILKWLLDSFSRDRVLGHKYLYQKAAVGGDKYRFDADKYSTGYNPTSWWLHDADFCKYIQYKNAKMALPMMTAVQALSKRVLPQINFNSQLTQVIHDNLNHFVKYTLATHLFIFNLITIYKRKYNVLPTQFDFVILPQLVKPGKINPLFNLKPYDSDLFFANTEMAFNEMGIWDLKTYLEDKGGYTVNTDFWLENICQGNSLEMLSQIIHKMWIKGAAQNETHERYIFIIDRRNPQNVAHQNMAYGQANYCKTSADWMDKIYLIKPKKYQNLTKKVLRIPEACLAYSAQYILPNVSILDALNGYKFALSYHLLQYNSVQTYFYINHGVEKFELNDIEWLWQRFFCRINANQNEQILNTENSILLKKYIKEKRFPDDKFFEFWKQCHAMRIIRS